MSSIALLPAMALGCVLSTIARNVVIKAWLNQGQEHSHLQGSSVQLRRRSVLHERPYVLL